MLLNGLYLAIGALLGAFARFAFTHYSSEFTRHHGFPIGTLLVNIVGSFLVGYVLTWTANHVDDRWRLFAATGFCGAFTTFSAFAYESIAYVHAGQWRQFGINVLLNNVLAMLAVVAGIAVHGNA